MASATFHYRAVASDGKLRTGVITAESGKTVARELVRQGLTPVYVGSEEKKSVALKLPSFGGARRRDVLFFTQELSTLLNSGVPLDRALSITSELTTRAQFRTIVLDILRSSKAANRSRTLSRCIPHTSRSCTSTWCARAKHRAASARSSNVLRNSSARATICAATLFRR